MHATHNYFIFAFVTFWWDTQYNQSGFNPGKHNVIARKITLCPSLFDYLFLGSTK